MDEVKIELRKMEYPIINGVTTPKVKSSRTIWAKTKSVNYNEFYRATAAGYQASIIFDVYFFEYCGEEEILFEKEIYQVIRSYRKNTDRLELTCQKEDGK